MKNRISTNTKDDQTNDNNTKKDQSVSGNDQQQFKFKGKQNIQPEDWQQIKITNECGFLKQELENFLRIYKRYDGIKNGSISFYDLINLLNEYGW